jgi:glycosyltransferase involved in cell wall biosynthesis
MKLAMCGPIETEPLRRYLPHGGADLPTGLGGSPVVALTRAAVEAGWDVTVFSLDESLERERVASGPGLKVCMGPFRARGRARDLFKAEREYLAAAIRRERPEVVHAHWTYEFALGAMEGGQPVVVTAHDRPLRILRWDRSPYRMVRTVMAGMVARRARWLTAVSAGVAEHFTRFFLRRGGVPVIANALEPEWFEGEGRKGGTERFVFASALTGWGPLKNGATLLEAFAQVRRAIPRVQLRLFGYGHGKGEAAEQWARLHGFAEGVDFMGQCERGKLRAQLREVDALVHPSLEESCAMVVAEAMALQVPVIAARNSGSLAETVGDGRAALLVDCRTAGALAGGMTRLAAHPDLCEELARKGRAAVATEYSTESVLEQYRELYARAVA